MKSLLIIHTDHGGLIFAIAYLVAFLTAAAIMLYQGYRKGYPMVPWMLILVSGVLFFIIGDKACNFSFLQWKEILTAFSLPEASEKNAAGGVIGLFAGIMLAKLVLGFRSPVFDHLSVGLLIAMAISKIGCFYAGCCFGVPTSLPIGVAYEPGSHVYLAQLSNGLIGYDSQGSLPVHPVQLYQMVGCLVLAVIVWQSRNFWKSGGSLFLFSATGYGILRFILEFMGDPHAASLAAPGYLGLNSVQWLIMAAAIPAIFILVFREYRLQTSVFGSSSFAVSEIRQVLLILFLSGIIILLRSWFDPTEYITILLFFIPVLIMTIAGLYRNHTPEGFRRVMPGILICSLLFMAQKSESGDKEDGKSRFTEVGFIGILGRYGEDLAEITKTYQGDGGCVKSTAATGDYVTGLKPLGSFKSSFWQTGFDLSTYRLEGKYDKITFGARAFFGMSSGEMTTEYPGKISAGVSPYFKREWQYFGLGVGVSLGQIIVTKSIVRDTMTYDDMSEHDIVATNMYRFYFLPAVSFRAGPADIIYAEGAFPASFPSAVPNMIARAGIGSGLGKTDGTKVGLGYCNGLYAQVCYPLSEKWLIEAVYVDNFQGGVSESRAISLGVRLRVPKK